MRLPQREPDFSGSLFSFPGSERNFFITQKRAEKLTERLCPAAFFLFPKQSKIRSKASLVLTGSRCSEGREGLPLHSFVSVRTDPGVKEAGSSHPHFTSPGLKRWGQ